MTASTKYLAIWLLCLLGSGGCCCLNYGPCGDGGAGGCVSGGCAARPPLGGRLPSAVYHWANRRLSCGAGCGPVYWHEWMMDPPACCDPCDDCGHWSGPHGCDGGCGTRFCSGPRRPIQSILTNLFARRYQRVDCSCAACSGGTLDAAPMLQPSDVGWDSQPGCSHCGH